MTVYLYDYVFEDPFFLQKAPLSEIFFLLWQNCLFSQTMKTQTAVTFWLDVDPSHWSHMLQHILNGKFHNWWDDEVKPVIYITWNEIKYYFNLCRATNGAHIKSYLRCQKIWGFLQILKHLITFFSFIYYSLLHPECMNFFFQWPCITGAELPFLIFYYSKKQHAPLHGKLLFINQCTRSVQKVSVHF